MRTIKILCQYGSESPSDQDNQMSTVQPHETHPALAMTLDSLNAYSRWVSTMVLPIAFAYIEEHKPEVYANVPVEIRDDVGVAIAAAFELVKEQPFYQEGQRRGAAYEAAMAAGTFDTSKTNPVWTAALERMRAEARPAFDASNQVVRDLREPMPASEDIDRVFQNVASQVTEPVGA